MERKRSGEEQKVQREDMYNCGRRKRVSIDSWTFIPSSSSFLHFLGHPNSIWTSDKNWEPEQHCEMCWERGFIALREIGVFNSSALLFYNSLFEFFLPCCGNAFSKRWAEYGAAFTVPPRMVLFGHSLTTLSSFSTCEIGCAWPGHSYGEQTEMFVYSSIIRSLSPRSLPSSVIRSIDDASRL